MACQHSDHTEANSDQANVHRRTADFHPSVWGDFFLKYATETSEIDAAIEEQVQSLKEEVKRILLISTTTVTNTLYQTLELVDTIQRLGVSYHFEEEISEILRQIKNCTTVDEFEDYDLQTVSLWFRLLRQEGYNISRDIFRKFTNEEGKFKDELVSDVQGILSLYEAAHFMVDGEPILEEALTFATVCLKSLITSTSSSFSPFLAEQVKHALELPILKELPRVMARHFISIYHLRSSHNEDLLKFAKLDFNSVQELHRKELGYITRWWKVLEMESKLPYARDRLAELYFWTTGVFFEPKYALGRSILLRVLSLLSIIDDTYDTHASFHELQVLTPAIERWNMDCVDELPDYMKHIYKALLDTYDDIQKELEKEGIRSFQMEYAKDAMKKIVHAYFEEAKCYHKNYVPTVEEYLQLFGRVTSAVWVLTVTSFLGMGETATQEAFEWVSKFPKIIHGGSLIIRLLNDVVGHEGEQKRGHVVSSVECYMKQHGASKEEAYFEIRKLVAEVWKGINEDLLEPRAVPMCLLVRALNLARLGEVTYKVDDIYTRSEGHMKRLVQDALVDPFPV